MAFPASANATETEYATPISTRLNPTGRTIALLVPVKDFGSNLGDVTIQITAGDEILVNRTELLSRIADLLSDTQRRAVAELTDAGGFVPIGAFKETGVGVRFDNGLQELELELAGQQRKLGDISLSGNRGRRISADLSEPQAVSGYVNLIGGFDYDWDVKNSAATGAGGRLDLESAIRLHGAVIENRAAYEGGVDASICPPGALCTYGHVAGLKRQVSRIVYDMPEHDIRVAVGDTDPLAQSMQRPVDILGLSIEKSDDRFHSGDAAFLGSGGFYLERPSDVEVRINGIAVHRLHLRPGNYTLRDLPLTPGVNDVELSITDDQGQSRQVTFRSYQDATLLKEGESAWGTAFGLESYLRDNERNYVSRGGMATGFFRYGLSDLVTAEADVQGDRSVIMAGFGATVGTDWGKFSAHTAASSSTAGAGVAADLGWSLSDTNGIFSDRSESMFLDAEYRSTDFHTPGEYLEAASGLLYPEFNYWLRLSGAYSVGFANGVTATVAGRYQFSNDAAQALTSYTVLGDRYGADLTLSKNLSDTTSASLLVGYSNEFYPFFDPGLKDTDGEFRASLRFNVRPEARTSITAGYDTLGKQATLSAYRSEGDGIGRWDTSVDAQSWGSDDSANVNASAGYYGNRAEVRVAHFAQMDGVDYSAFESATAQQRTSLRVGTSIAFAGDRIAIGAPIRGGAFAIVAPHESLADREITVGTGEQVRARADALGPAVVGDLPAYLPGTVPIDIDDLPIGYSLGRSNFDTFAPYKAGYALDVGSANSVSVYGTLVDDAGAALALLTGTAHPEGQAAPAVSIFTNASGRFGAEGLGPGRWIMEMATEGEPTRYLIEVPVGTQGFIKVGTLKPLGR